jgi:hypothetical protein
VGVSSAGLITPLAIGIKTAAKTPPHTHYGS